MSPTDIINGIQEKLYAETDIDYIGMYEGIGITGEIVQTLLGLMVTIVIVGMSVIVALEILFINIPFFKASILLRMEKEDNVSKILGLSLRDAKRAILEADTINTGKSVNSIYFRIKAKSIFIVTVLIGLIIGPGGMLVTFLGNRIQDILNLI